MNRLSETQQKLIIVLYNTIQDMISIDNIEDTDNLKVKMAFILLQKPFIPIEIFDLIEDYLNDSIKPIIDNNEPICYLDNELGFINENGLFEFYSVYEFIMYLDIINDLCTNLKHNLDNTFLAFISPY